MNEDQPHERRICGAKTRSGKPCQKSPMEGRNRCRLHGGATPRGAFSPHFKHGKYSRYLPHDVRQMYQRALSDPDMISVRDEIALIRAMITHRLEHWPESAEGRLSRAELRAMQSIRRDVDRVRKLVLTQHRINHEKSKLITADEVLILIGQVLDVITAVVTDQTQRAEIARGISALIGHTPHRIN